MKPIAVFIGRFQPFHYGHQAIIDRLEATGHTVIVVVGIPVKLSDRNPIGPTEVKDAIQASFNHPLDIRFILDKDDNSEWIESLDYICSTLHSDDLSLVVHNKPTEAGKYGLPENDYFSDVILEESKYLKKAINLSKFKTKSIDATRIRLFLDKLLEWAPKHSIQTLLTAK